LKSFYGASEEGAITRVYGGIHQRSAMTNGVTEGRAVGDLIIKRLKTRKEAFAEKE